MAVNATWRRSRANVPPGPAATPQLVASKVKQVVANKLSCFEFDNLLAATCLREPVGGNL